MKRLRWGELGKEAVAGIPGALGSVPDGMASSVLAGVNPIHGLYASFAGPIAGGFTASTKRMVIATTTAAALATGGALESIPAADRTGALFLLTALAGGLMVLAGLLRLGRYTRFVSHSVMLGFLTGVAFNMIFGQLPDLTGVPAEGDTAITKATYVVLHPGQIQLASLLTGLAAIAIVAAMSRTRYAPYGAVLGLVIPTTIAALAGAEIALVKDTGEIPTGLPLPGLPSLSYLTPDLVIAALAIAVIVLIQGAGVAEAAPNLDASRSDTNRDFIAQGAGNLASGLFQGQPVGGSVSQTALNIASGARTRWASIFSGLWMALILVAFSGAVGKVAMTTLAGMLIFAAVDSLRAGEALTVYRTGMESKIAMITTFVATLLLSIPAAVGIGVALSLLLQLNQEAMDLTVVRLTPTEDGRTMEGPVPTRAISGEVLVLDIHGSLLYAGSRTLEVRLPDPDGCHRAVVVLRLRGRSRLGSTFFAVITDYAARLGEGGGRLYLTGVGSTLLEQMRSARILDDTPGLVVVAGTEVVGDSTRDAYAQARAWLEEDDPS